MRAARALAISIGIHVGLLGLAWIGGHGRASSLIIAASENVNVVEALGVGKRASHAATPIRRPVPAFRRPPPKGADRNARAIEESGSGSGRADKPRPDSGTHATISLAIKPRYPRASRALGEEGSVVLHARLLSDGSLTDVHLVRTSGFARLDSAALEAAHRAQAVFSRPPGVEDPARAVERDFTIVFRLTDPD